MHHRKKNSGGAQSGSLDQLESKLANENRHKCVWFPNKVHPSTFRFPRLKHRKPSRREIQHFKQGNRQWQWKQKQGMSITQGGRPPPTSFTTDFLWPQGVGCLRRFLGWHRVSWNKGASVRLGFAKQYFNSIDCLKFAILCWYFKSLKSLTKIPSGRECQCSKKDQQWPGQLQTGHLLERIYNGHALDLCDE